MHPTLGQLKTMTIISPSFDWGGGYYSLNLSDSPTSGIPLTSLQLGYIPLVALLAIATLFVFLWLLYGRKSFRLPWWGALIGAVLHTVIGVESVMVFAALENLIADGDGVMSLYGGIFFMPLFYFVFAKITKNKIRDCFDLFTPCLIATLLFARLNCLISGCCIGKQIAGTGIRYPTRSIELLGNAVFLGVALSFFCKGRMKGLLYPLYMVEYGILRFVLEWFRDSPSGSPLHLAHLWSLASVFFGLLFLIPAHIKAKRERNEGVSA